MVQTLYVSNVKFYRPKTENLLIASVNVQVTQSREEMYFIFFFNLSTLILFIYKTPN